MPLNSHYFFNPIDCDHYFYIHVGNALQLIRLYFSVCTQRLQIHGILSDLCQLVMWGATGLSFGANEMLFLSYYYIDWYFLD